jgi:hypothetical protein
VSSAESIFVASLHWTCVSLGQLYRFRYITSLISIRLDLGISLREQSSANYTDKYFTSLYFKTPLIVISKTEA